MLLIFNLEGTGDNVLNRGGNLALTVPPRVLMLLDQQLVAETIKLTLTHGGYLVREAEDVADARHMIGVWRPHILILDMDFGGDRLLEQLGGSQTEGARIPVLALTRRGDLKRKLSAFDLGVDDVVTLPFPPEELLARMLVITRRTYAPRVSLTPVVTVGQLEIDIMNRRVRAGSSELYLTGLEQSLLYLLAANAGKVITREQILDVLWGSDYVAESNVIDRHVRSLRAKLQNDWRKPRFIETVPGRGYRFLPVLGDDGRTAEPADPEPVRS